MLLLNSSLHCMTKCLGRRAKPSFWSAHAVWAEGDSRLNCSNCASGLLLFHFHVGVSRLRFKLFPAVKTNDIATFRRPRMYMIRTTKQRDSLITCTLICAQNIAKYKSSCPHNLIWCSEVQYVWRVDCPVLILPKKKKHILIITVMATKFMTYQVKSPWPGMS